MSYPISPWTLGRVKFYNAGKGYGFVYKDATGKDIFLHASVLLRSGYNGPLYRDIPIEVHYVETEKGLNAINVRVPK